MVKRFVPILILLLFIGIAIWGLTRSSDTQVKSRMVGQPLPELAQAAALPDKPGLDSKPGQGPRLINVFASWCVPCIAEAPLLDQLAREGVIIDGIAVRDRPRDIADFLARNGDPFARLGADPDSAAMIALGASGVPETFVVNGKGVITYQHMGPISPQDLSTLRQELEAAR